MAEKKPNPFEGARFKAEKADQHVAKVSREVTKQIDALRESIRLRSQLNLETRKMRKKNKKKKGKDT